MTPSFVETYGMDLVSKQINSLFRLNDGSLQGFEWFYWNYLFLASAKLYEQNALVRETSDVIPCFPKKYNNRQTISIATKHYPLRQVLADGRVAATVMPDCRGVGESRIYSKRAKKSSFAGLSGITAPLANHHRASIKAKARQNDFHNVNTKSCENKTNTLTIL